MKAEIELRNQVRRPFFGKVDFWIYPGRREEDRKQGRLLDLSGTGLRIISFEPVVTGQKIRVITGNFEAIGTIRWTRRKRIFFWHCYHVGIQFDKLQPARQSMIVQQSY